MFKKNKNREKTQQVLLPYFHRPRQLNIKRWKDESAS